MRLIRSLVLACVCVHFVAACSTPSSASEERAAPPAATGQSFGQPLSVRAPVPLVDVVAHPDRFVGQVVRTSGPVQAVCQHRGCWMDIGAADESQGRIHVRSLDHSISFPRDAVGKTAEVEGEVQAMPGVPGCASPHEADGTAACGEATAGRRIQLAVRGALLR